jgi:hypothetical protein
MGYLDELRAVSEKHAGDLPTEPTEGGSVGFVSASSGHFQRDERRIQRGWRTALATLDPCQPRGMEMGRWQMLVDCSVWLFNTFGEQAARDGFSTADLFGLRAGYPGKGGLDDHLGDNRGLVMADGRACWRAWGVPMQFNRGGGDDLPAFWEMGQ